MDSNGVPVARNIGLNTLRLIVDSIHNLGKDDMSAEAQQKRNIAGIQVLQGQEFCFLIGVEPEKNGYAAKNKMTTPLILGMKATLLALLVTQSLLVSKVKCHQPQRLEQFRLGRLNSLVFSLKGVLTAIFSVKSC